MSSTMVHPETVFQQSDRPNVALITDHGYGGVEIPVGGAPDTGGQILYVNSLARALDELGFRVTIFARGGFPHFDSDRIRGEPEYLTGHVRYVFVPGGGDTFIRKEDIAIALDEQIDWLDAFIRGEAAERGCFPWEVYEFINTHYWDAAILGTRLVERWRNDVAAAAIGQLLQDAVPDSSLRGLKEERHWLAVGDAPAFHLGYLLINHAVSPAVPLVERVRGAAERLARARGEQPETLEKGLVQAAQSAEGGSEGRIAPILKTILASDKVGAAVLDLFPQHAEDLRRQLDAVDRHVWTPHSLGSLKDQNFRDQPVEVRRGLKFCERRSHERTVCSRTPMFAATSEEIATQLRTHFRVPAERIFYFPPCVDPDVFRPYQQHELEATYRYVAELSGIPEETLRASHVLLETSRMDETKRKDLLLDAFARVARRRDDVFLFIGGGPETDLYKSLIERRDAHPDLVGRAFLTGFIPHEHIGPLFSLADVYVSPSEMEGFGMCALQAAASGTALVVSDRTPFAVQYVPESALVVPAGDIDGFAEAMEHMLDDEADCRKRIRGLLDRVKALQWEAQTLTFIKRLKEAGFPITLGIHEK
jgi:glycosyltransferase involved in cell wall biosynthesis